MLSFIAITSLFCFGLRLSSENHMILEQVRLHMEHYLRSWVHKPLFSCCSCMASVYGTLFFFGFGCPVIMLHGWLLNLLIFVVAVCGLNGLLWHLYMAMIKFITSR